MSRYTSVGYIIFCFLGGAVTWITSANSRWRAKQKYFSNEKRICSPWCPLSSDDFIFGARRELHNSILWPPARAHTYFLKCTFETFLPFLVIFEHLPGSTLSNAVHWERLQIVGTVQNRIKKEEENSESPERFIGFWLVDVGNHKRLRTCDQPQDSQSNHYLISIEERLGSGRLRFWRGRFRWRIEILSQRNQTFLWRKPHDEIYSSFKDPHVWAETEATAFSSGQASVFLGK